MVVGGKVVVVVVVTVVGEDSSHGKQWLQR